MARARERDVVGYGRHVPKVTWPNGARVAVSLVAQLGGGLGVLEDRRRRPQRGPGRDPLRDGAAVPRPRARSRSTSTAAAPACGACSGCSTSSSVPVTFFGAGGRVRAQPRGRRSTCSEAGHEPCCHGWRWEEVWTLSREEEREHMLEAIQSIETHMRGAAARLVLPLRPVGQHARAAGRGGRLRLRLRRLQRRPALLHRGQRQAASRRPLLADLQRRPLRAARRASRTRPRSSTSVGAAWTSCGRRARRTRG